MKRILSTAAAAGLSLSLMGAATAPAFADGYRNTVGRYDQKDHRAYQKYQRDVQRAREKYERELRKDRRQDRRQTNNAYRQGYEAGLRQANRGYSNYGYYSGNQPIYDYGRYGLNAPPNGQYYAQQNNGDIVLVMAATQLIASLLSD